MTGQPFTYCRKWMVTRQNLIVFWSGSSKPTKKSMDKRVTIAVPDQEAGQSQLFIDVDLKEKMAQVALVKLASDISFDNRKKS